MTCVQGPGQYSIYGMGHRICFQPPGVGFHHCKQMVFALVGFWDSDRVNMPGHLIFRLQPLSSIPNCLAGLIVSCVTLTNNLSGSVCGQDHPGITRPSLMSHNFFDGVMGPPSQKSFTLMVPNQVHLSHTRLNSQTHLLVVLVFFSCPTHGQMCIHVAYLHNRVPLPISCHNAAAQMGLCLHCQLFCFHHGSHHSSVNLEV